MRPPKRFQPSSRPKHANRRGVTTVETAIIIMPLMIVLLGMVELSIVVFRYHVVSEAARQGARQVIVHGALAPPEMAAWGPATIDVLADVDGIPFVAALRPFLFNLDMNQTRVRCEWLDGNTGLESNVRVTVDTDFQPLTFLFGSSAWSLSAASVMQIAH